MWRLPGPFVGPGELLSQVTGTSEFHSNADEPTVIVCNLDGKPQDLYINNAYRASDFDLVIITFDFAPMFTDVGGTKCGA